MVYEAENGSLVPETPQRRRRVLAAPRAVTR